jgi:hypothetical protein
VGGGGLKGSGGGRACKEGGGGQGGAWAPGEVGWGARPAACVTARSRLRPRPGSRHLTQAAVEDVRRHREDAATNTARTRRLLPDGAPGAAGGADCAPVCRLPTPPVRSRRPRARGDVAGRGGGRCGDVAMWRCGDVAMWRCVTYLAGALSCAAPHCAGALGRAHPRGSPAAGRGLGAGRAAGRGRRAGRPSECSCDA